MTAPRASPVRPPTPRIGLPAPGPGRDACHEPKCSVMRPSTDSQVILKEPTCRAAASRSVARRSSPRAVGAGARSGLDGHPLACAPAIFRRPGRGSLAALELDVVFVGARLDPPGSRRGPLAPLVTCPYAISVIPAARGIPRSGEVARDDCEREAKEAERRDHGKGSEVLGHRGSAFGPQLGIELLHGSTIGRMRWSDDPLVA